MVEDKPARRLACGNPGCSTDLARQYDILAMVGPERAKRPSAWERWLPRLRRLCDEIREVTRAALVDALREERPDRVDRPRGAGVGDVSYGLDLPSEELIDRWLLAEARRGPLSVLTEERGWRHLGPGADGGEPVELPGFDHGGVRIAFDPVDGTRNLMADLRSAWTVVSFANPGPDVPRLGELAGGMVSEIPVTRARGHRLFHAAASGPCWLEETDPDASMPSPARRVVTDDDDRPDHGYFPFFRYKPALRPDISRLEAAFFAAIEEHEGADLLTCYDDQYLSNAGQLVLLVLGTYRMVVDSRALVGKRRGVRTTTSKPYDVAGAMVCARAAGAELTAADGGALDFPIDARTPVDFAGYVNPATRARLEPHWLRALRDDPGS